jgi:CRP-like cAMP-binding protein
MSTTGHIGRLPSLARTLVSPQLATSGSVLSHILLPSVSYRPWQPRSEIAPTPNVPRTNRLLASLSGADYRRVARHLEPVALPLEQILCEAGTPPEHVYFPVTCMVSMVAVIDGRGMVEVGLVGRYGMVGVPLAFGIQESPTRGVVQGKGTAVRMPAAEFAREAKRNASLRAAAERFAYASMATAMLIAACNRAHDLQSRLARWLLMSRDCLSTNTFEMTQEFLGNMLGARRPSVNIAATALQRQQLITYTRGVVRLINIPGLQVAACACYPEIRRLTKI